MDPAPDGSREPDPSRVTMAMRVSAQAFADEESLARIDALLEADPDDVKVLFARACCLEDSARYEAAKRAYAAVLEREPANFGALTNLGSLLHLHDERVVSRALFTKAVVEHPDEPMGYVNLGNALFEDGEHRRGRGDVSGRLARTGRLFRTCTSRWPCSTGTPATTTRR